MDLRASVLQTSELRLVIERLCRRLTCMSKPAFLSTIRLFQDILRRSLFKLLTLQFLGLFLLEGLWLESSVWWLVTGFSWITWWSNLESESEEGLLLETRLLD